MLNGKTILITGGTGSFGKAFIRKILSECNPAKVIVYSRDEFKQYEMQQKFTDKRLRYFLGDVRDSDRLHRALTGVDYVVHAAAIKHVPAAEYNPFEAIQTNVIGAQNVINSCLDCGVEKIIALSTDKACNPVNLYGATKLCSDKLFIAANAYVGQGKSKFSVVRYGNVLGSRGSIVPLFRKLAEDREDIPITDDRMTRFWITLPQAVQFVIDSFRLMNGGELFIPKIPSMKIVDLATAIAPESKIKIIGIRPGEKLHEMMISADDSRNLYELKDRYVKLPDFPFWKIEPPKDSKPVEPGFVYASDTNKQWMGVEELREVLAQKGVIQ